MFSTPTFEIQTRDWFHPSVILARHPYTHTFILPQWVSSTKAFQLGAVYCWWSVFWGQCVNSSCFHLLMMATLWTSRYKCTPLNIISLAVHFRSNHIISYILPSPMWFFPLALFTEYRIPCVITKSHDNFVWLRFENQTCWWTSQTDTNKVSIYINTKYGNHYYNRAVLNEYF